MNHRLRRRQHLLAIALLAIAGATCRPAANATTPTALGPLLLALHSADTAGAAAAARGDAEVRCAAAFRTLALDGVAAAFDDLCALAEHEAAPQLRTWAGRALLATLRAEGQWDRLATLRRDRPGLGIGADAIPAAMLAWRTPRFDPPSDAVTLELDPEAAADGRVVVRWELRGPAATRTLRAVVDTGAATCAISAGLAAELGLQPVTDVPLPVIGIHGAKSAGRAALLERLQFGGLVAHGVPVSVLPDDVLGAMLGDISCILGWEVLQQVALELDHGGRTLTVGPAATSTTGEPNLWLLGEPAVAVACNGIPALFRLDTGSGVTQLSLAGAERLGVTTLARRAEDLHGIGGVTRTEVATLAKLVLRSGEVELGLEGLTAAAPASQHELLRIDGVLGMDVLGALRVTIDAKARRLRLRAR